MHSNTIRVGHAHVALPPLGFPSDKGELWLWTTEGNLTKCRGNADTERFARYPDLLKEEEVWLHTMTSLQGASIETNTFILFSLEDYTFFRLLIDIDKVGGVRALELIRKADFAAVKAMSLPELVKYAGEVTAERLAKVLQKHTGAAAPAAKVKHPQLEDAVKAVAALGNKVTDARAWVTFVCSQPGTEGLELQEIIKRALKKPTK
jgi:Holliday junction resolvasome RuvABC DNA-binding subunit